MKNYIVLTVVIIAAFITVNAQASNIFIKRKSSSNAPPPVTAPPASTITPEKNSTSPAAQPESMSDFANRYYRNCLTKETPTLRGQPLQMMCACSSSRITESMTIDEIKIMSTNTPEGQIQRNRMLLQVYTPCMQYPANALLLHNCLNDEKVRSSIKNYKKVCTCMADEMSTYVSQNAPATIAASLREHPEGLDPLGALVNSQSFQSQSQSSLMGCLQKHAR